MSNTKGRKPLPTAQKQRQGTARKDRVLANEMQPTKVMAAGDPPQWLNEEGRLEWLRIAPELSAAGVLAQTDLALLAAYCNEMGLYLAYEKALHKGERIQTYYNEDGSVKHTQLSASHRIAKEALTLALKLASEYGLTPSARSKVAGRGPGAEEEGELFT
jgi:P27 family predicted phage terminase small subunit